jgi:hypothetical protein
VTANPVSGAAGPRCLGPIPEVNASASERILAYRNQRTPFVIRGALAGWPALDRWTVEYLGNRYADKLVKVQQLDPDGVTRYQLESLKEVRFADFIDAVSTVPPRERWYLVIGNIQSSPGLLSRFSAPVFPELASDLELPTIADPKTLFEINLWVGCTGATSNLHFDPHDNCLCQVRGHKDLLLFAPDQERYLYMPSPRGTTNPLHSAVDPVRPNFERFPEFTKAAYSTCRLDPGDLVYLPAGHFHHVRSSEFNVAVNFWWRDSRWWLRQLRPPLRRATLWFLHERGRSMFPRAKTLGRAAARRREPEGA